MDYNLDIKEEPLENLDSNAELNSFSSDIENDGIVKEEYKILSIEDKFNEEIEETIEEVECTICQRLFECEMFLKEHIKTHIASEEIDNKNLKEKFLECEKCSKDFNTENELKNHILFHENTMANKGLNVAEVDLISKKKKDHMRTQAGERSFKCEICSKSLRDRYILTAHMRIHTGERPFTCEVCKKGFSISSNLKRHMSVHGSKPMFYSKKLK